MTLSPLLDRSMRFVFKIRFQRSRRADVLIFDRVGAEFLQTAITNQIETVIIPARNEEFPLSLRIVFFMLVNTRVLFQTQGISQRRAFIDRLIVKLNRIYSLALVKATAPKVVITITDNSRLFHWLSMKCPHIEFIPLQNGVRCPHDLIRLPPPDDIERIISSSAFYCHSSYDVEYYQKFGHQIASYSPIGSVYMSYYYKHLRKISAPSIANLCLVSQWDEAVLGGQGFPEITRGLTILNDFLRRFISQHGYTLAVALRSNERSKEWQLFQNVFGTSAIIVPRTKNIWSSYDCAFSSDVIITMDSTLAREAFGCGKKVLFTNFSDFEQYDCPESGFWFLKGPNYNKFSDALLYLLSLPQSEYQNLSRRAAAHIMHFDPERPAHDIVKEKIRTLIQG